MKETNDILNKRIRKVLKLCSYDINIDSNLLLQQVNYIFDTKYTLEEVNLELGFLYEEQFYAEQLKERMEREIGI